jgi:hypothetical protein
MHVDDYAFGRITVDGRAYAKDVLLLPGGRVHSPWWRREGHNLVPEDLTKVLADPPATLVIGTGYHGNMAVPEQTLRTLREHGVEPWVGRTGEAVAELNRLQERASRVAGALHLTC